MVGGMPTDGRCARRSVICSAAGCGAWQSRILDEVPAVLLAAGLVRARPGALRRALRP